MSSYGGAAVLFIIMRLPLFLLLAVAATLLGGTPPPERDYSAKAAKQEAAQDIKTGHLKIYLAGGVVLNAPGITGKDDALVAKLPRDNSLPSGCTAPHAPEAYTYATAYNEAIVAYLKKAK